MPLFFSYLSSLPSFILHFIMHTTSAESPVHNTRSLFSTNHRDSLVFVFLHLVWVHFVNWQFRNWNVCTRKFPAVCLSLLLLAITRRCKRAHKNNHQNFICWLQFSLFSAGRFFQFARRSSSTPFVGSFATTEKLRFFVKISWITFSTHKQYQIKN